MPRQTDRREVLAGAVIRVLARAGAHGLTHRAVDAEAQVPVGTTSRYFRSRAALLLVAAETVRDRHRTYVQRLAGIVPQSRVGLIGALAALVADAASANRDLYIARFELILESLRNDQLRSIMDDVRAANLDAAERLMLAAGIELSAGDVDILGSFLVGVSLDRITLERPHVTNQDIVSSLVHGIIPPADR